MLNYLVRYSTILSSE